jgi:hypothetical protein
MPGICAAGGACRSAVKSFFKSFDRLEKSLRGSKNEVIRRITGELGGQFEAIEQLHAVSFFVGSELLIDQIREQEHAEVLDADDGRGCLGRAYPVDFDGFKEVIDE